MANDHDNRGLPQAALPQGGGDVGGIPSPLNQGVDDATDRASGRREGTVDSDAGTTGGSVGASLPVPADSAALPQEARDRTPAAGAGAGPRQSGGSSMPPQAGEPTPGDPRDPRDADPARSDGSHPGSDDSAAESLGKAISEPFRSS
jgi:hypothetical protein